jgi:hypothetical protein
MKKDYRGKRGSAVFLEQIQELLLHESGNLDTYKIGRMLLHLASLKGIIEPGIDEILYVAANEIADGDTDIFFVS